MFEVLSLTIPFFGIIALGAFSRAIGFFEADMGYKLARFAFYFVLPPFFFLAINAAPVEELFNIGFLWRYELATFIMLVGAGLISIPLFGFSGIKRGLYGLNAAYPNVGYIGFPLALMAFGTNAVLPLAMILAIDTVILLVLTAFFITSDKDNTLTQSLAHISVQLLRNPLILSAIIGLSWAYLDLPIPAISERFLTLLSGAAAPSALFALGITLWGADLKGAHLELGLLAIFKLFIHPALVTLLFIGASDMDPVWIQTAILSAAMPIAANVFAMSQYYGVYSEKTAGAIMLSTVIASLTTSTVLYWLFSYFGS
ncbi:MAG: AEC family transporter [Candidatus Puniceispirillaceae bacterium]